MYIDLHNYIKITFIAEVVLHGVEHSLCTVRNEEKLPGLASTEYCSMEAIHIKGKTVTLNAILHCMQKKTVLYFPTTVLYFPN